MILKEIDLPTVYFYLYLQRKCHLKHFVEVYIGCTKYDSFCAAEADLLWKQNFLFLFPAHSAPLPPAFP